MNPENRKQMIILGVLVGALALVGAYQFLGAGSPPKTPRKSTATKKATTDTRINQPKFEGDLDQLLAGIAEVTFDYRRATGDRPSPMQPKIATRVMIDDTSGTQQLRSYDVERLHVSGIVWDETDPYAVVEGEVVSNGYDYGNGLKVLSIEPDRVIFDLDGFAIPVEMEEL